MRLQRSTIISCVLAFVLLAVVGCSKKGDEGAPPAGPSGTPTKTPAVDTDKPVAEAQAEAGTMSVEGLKAMAVKYKDAILAKRAEVEAVLAKVKEIPLPEALGEKAQALKADMQKLEGKLTALKERFQVYYDALKQKGADLTGLEL